jgi:hypothetical protein
MAGYAAAGTKVAFASCMAGCTAAGTKVAFASCMAGCAGAGTKMAVATCMAGCTAAGTKMAVATCMAGCPAAGTKVAVTTCMAGVRKLALMARELPASLPPTAASALATVPLLGMLHHNCLCHLADTLLLLHTTHAVSCHARSWRVCDHALAKGREEGGSVISQRKRSVCLSQRKRSRGNEVVDRFTGVPRLCPSAGALVVSLEVK